MVYKKKGDDPAGARTKTWCLRKMGISARNRSFVFIQPSDAFASKLKLSWSGGSDLYSAAKVHLMAVEAANEDWTDYLNELEEKLIEIVTAPVKSPYFVRQSSLSNASKTETGHRKLGR